ncbi:unnamed protein product [Jaminaea pallidilutea]
MIATTAPRRVLGASANPLRFLGARGLATAAPPVTWTPAPASKPATLHLKSGHSWSGKSFGAPVPKRFGEVVFTTSITSYTESLTDPSYQGQILTFTQPLIGNYGVPNNFSGRSPVGHLKDVDVGSFLESRGVQAAGVVVSNLAERFSHFEAIESLASWCARHNVPGITGVDTRAVTTLLRDQGSTLGAICIGDGHETKPGQDEFIDPMQENLIARVSTKSPYVVHPVGGAGAARAHVALFDFGSKANIVRCLIRQGVSVTVLPFDYDFTAVQDRFDGLFLSNGPGSPYSIPGTIDVVTRTVKTWDRPIMGICMGHQIIGISAGVPAYKMPFGNRGHNQPIVCVSPSGKAGSIKSGRVLLSSQNHSYCLQSPLEQTWPEGWACSFVNANDGTVEGIQSTEESGKVVWGVQMHPEAAGGPEDGGVLFEDWVGEVVKKMAGRPIAQGLEASELKAPPSGAFGAIAENAAQLQMQ